MLVGCLIWVVYNCDYMFGLFVAWMFVDCYTCCSVGVLLMITWLHVVINSVDVLYVGVVCLFIRHETVFFLFGLLVAYSIVVSFV